MKHFLFSQNTKKLAIIQPVRKCEYVRMNTESEENFLFSFSRLSLSLSRSRPSTLLFSLSLYLFFLSSIPFCIPCFSRDSENLVHVRKKTNAKWKKNHYTNNKKSRGKFGKIVHVSRLREKWNVFMYAKKNENKIKIIRFVRNKWKICPDSGENYIPKKWDQLTTCFFCSIISLLLCVVPNDMIERKKKEKWNIFSLDHLPISNFSCVAIWIKSWSNIRSYSHETKNTHQHYTKN